MTLEFTNTGNTSLENGSHLYHNPISPSVVQALLIESLAPDTTIPLGNLLSLLEVRDLEP